MNDVFPENETDRNKKHPKVKAAGAENKRSDDQAVVGNIERRRIDAIDPV